MNQDELLDEVNLFLLKHHPDIEYDFSLISATSVMRINKKFKNHDFEAIMKILLEWYNGEFKTWEGGNTWKVLNNYHSTILFMAYFNYWDDRDEFYFNYSG